MNYYYLGLINSHLKFTEAYVDPQLTVLPGRKASMQYEAIPWTSTGRVATRVTVSPHRHSEGLTVISGASLLS